MLNNCNGNGVNRAADYLSTIMTTNGNFVNETTIYVSTKTKLNTEQTQNITTELLRIMGAHNTRGLKFQFIADDGLTQAHASVDDRLKVSVNNW